MAPKPHHVVSHCQVRNKDAFHRIILLCQLLGVHSTERKGSDGFGDIASVRPLCGVLLSLLVGVVVEVFRNKDHKYHGMLKTKQCGYDHH